MLGGAQQRGGLRDRSAAGALATGGMKRAASIGGDRLGELLLLHAGVEIDVSRPARRGVGDPAGAQHAPRARQPARPAGRPIWCSRAPARPGRARCGSSRSTAAA